MADKSGASEVGATRRVFLGWSTNDWSAALPEASPAPSSCLDELAETGNLMTIKLPVSASSSIWRPKNFTLSTKMALSRGLVMRAQMAAEDRSQKHCHVRLNGQIAN